MRMKFSQTLAFTRVWRTLGLTDEDLQQLEGLILAAPDTAPLIRGTGGLRKVRFAPPSWHTGKRGAARVCYVYVVRTATAHLVAIYPKNAKADLTPAERAAYAKLIESLNAEQ